MHYPVVPWWGTYQLNEGECGVWRIGSAEVWITHWRGEWLVGRQLRGGEPLPEVEVIVPAPQSMPATASIERFAFRANSGRLTIQPRLADRPVITRPTTPLHLPPGEAVTLYVSTPLWFAVAAGEVPVALAEFPVNRPSDTWFGRPIRAGGLSYAASTAARSVLDEDFPFSAQRAVTPLRVSNPTQDRLSVERIRLPVPMLSLYAGHDNTLWTQAVSLARDEAEMDLAVLQVESGPPEPAGPATLLSAPRQEAARHQLFHAFGRLFT